MEIFQLEARGKRKHTKHDDYHCYEDPVKTMPFHFSLTALIQSKAHSMIFNNILLVLVPANVLQWLDDKASKKVDQSCICFCWLGGVSCCCYLRILSLNCQTCQNHCHKKLSHPTAKILLLVHSLLSNLDHRLPCPSVSVTHYITHLEGKGLKKVM